MPRRGENAKEQRRTARDRAPALPHEIKRENNEGTLPNRKEQTAQGRARPKSLSRARGGGVYVGMKDHTARLVHLHLAHNSFCLNFTE
jgi:hypothetical protein